MPKTPSQSPRKQLGQQGENLAKKLLLNKGYHFQVANYRTSFGEIDLIFADGPWLVFVEVKARHYLAQGLPEEAVTPAKLATIERVGQHYQQKTHQEDKLARIDVVAIEFIHEPPVLRHLENVTG